MNKSSITAVLFCGGKGSRLYPISEYYQKTMMPIGSKGTPALELIIEHLKSFGINNFVALIGYRANQVRSYFGDGSDFGINIEYVADNPNLKGTGGALLNASKHLDSKSFLLYYTDVLSNFNFTNFLDFHIQSESIGTIWIDQSWMLPNIIVKRGENDTVIDITHKPDNIFVNTSISVVENQLIDLIKEYKQSKPNLLQIDLSNDIFPILAEKSQLSGYLSDEWWFDIGSLKKYQQLDGRFIKVKFPHLKESV